jgi:hypothetical protein
MCLYSFFEVIQMNQTQNREIFSKEYLVSTYVSSEAVEDGFLFDLDLVVKQSSLGKFVLQYVTTNLLAKGYWNKDQSINQSISQTYATLLSSRLEYFARNHQTTIS